MVRRRGRSTALYPLLLAGPFCLLVAVSGWSTPSAVRSRGPVRSVWDSVYTQDQAKRGLGLFADNCSRCHGEDLKGIDDAAPLVGGEFLSTWKGIMVSDLHDRIRTKMPSDDPGTLERQQISDIIAYILQVNGFPAGAIELPVQPDSLGAIRIDSIR